MVHGWIEAAEWARVQQIIPIVCVDVLPVKWNADAHAYSAGLIWRDVPGTRRAWTLVGGRLFRGETMIEGVTRQLQTTLGTGIRFTLDPECQPHFIAEYFPDKRKTGAVDPRQHAIGMTFVVPIEGLPIPQGEAIAFEWFPLRQLPMEGDFGFGQGAIVAASLARWGNGGREIKSSAAE